jgi:mannan endo-1,4-beta-mannosidase
VRKHKTALALLSGMLLAGACVTGASHSAAAEPVQLAAAPADIVNYLKSISGRNTITGMHNKEPNSSPAQYTTRVHDITGLYPGLWGGDFLFGSADVAARQTMINEAKSEWSHGSLVNLTWHVCPPTQGTSCTWDTGVRSTLSDSQWNELVTNGTALNNAWKRRLDETVPFFQQFKDAGVPVMFRPIHEMNDGWSWWGGRPGANGSRRLFQITRDYLAGVKGFNNIVWVWNVKDLNPDAISQYYPGSSYADVVSLDPWNNFWPDKTYHDTLAAIAPGKPLALAEVGRIPTPAELAGQPLWTYFMLWSEYLDNGTNPPDRVRTTYVHPRSLNQGELPFPGGGSPGVNLALGKPVSASSVESSTHPAADAVDGNGSTRWSSAFADPQSIQVDLGSPVTVSRVQLTWEAAYGRAYQIQTSTDGTTWSTAFVQNAGDGAVDDITFASRSTRYVRMLGTQRGTQWGYSLWEFGVY